jgi:hypothetical protein
MSNISILLIAHRQNQFEKMIDKLIEQLKKGLCISESDLKRLCAQVNMTCSRDFI